MMKSKHWIVGLVAVAVVAAILLAIFWPQDGGDNADTINFRLKWLWYSGWAGELMAEHQDVWKDKGLTVKTRPGGFEIDPIKLVASGEDQIGVAGADQIFFARKNGVPLVAFAVQYQQSPVGFVSKDGSGIRTIKDFKGRRIGVKYGTDVEPVYRALLAQAGLSKSDVTEVPVKFDLAPFFSDAIDVYPGYLTNDLLIPGEKGYKVNTISAPAEGLSVYGNVYFCREDYLKQHPEQLTAFLSGLREAWGHAFSVPPSEVAELAMKKNSGLNSAHEIRVVKSLQPYIMPEGSRFGDMTDEGWQHLYNVLRKQGVLDRDFDYRSAYTMEIIDRLNNADK